MTTSDPALLALHGVRLRGMAAPETIAEVVPVEPDQLRVELEDLAREGFVALRDDPTTQWILTPAGRIHHEQLLAVELDATGGRPVLEAAYESFLDLNPRMLAACTRWQVIDPAAQRLNDHSDPAYDAAVIEDLVAIDSEVQPIVEGLAAQLDRYGGYGPRLASALSKVVAGDHRWFTKPIIASYHTVWFELHEDLLATLGLDRASEQIR